jgi:hypothetical protein
MAIRNAEAAGLALPVSAMVTAATLCSIAGLLHFAIKWRAKAKVFISYQHDQESVAEWIANQLQRSSIVIYKLPFRNKPEHDELLDDVRTSIKQSSLILCIPGRESSFVEDEIAMAFALSKPMLFVLSESDTPFLPNTAKKGYPLFDRQQIETDRGVTTLATFCSYLAADQDSTKRLYWSVLSSLRGCVLAAAAVYLAMLAILPGIIPLESRLSFALYFAVGVFLFSAAYLAFFLKRYIVRRRIKSVVARQRFDFRTLPDDLEDSLNREDLLRLQFKGEILARHERSGSYRAPELTVRSNVGSPILYLAGIYIVLPAFLVLLWVGATLPPGEARESEIPEQQTCLQKYDDSKFGPLPSDQDFQSGSGTTSSDPSAHSIDPAGPTRLQRDEATCLTARNERRNERDWPSAKLLPAFVILAFLNLYGLGRSHRFFSVLYRPDLLLSADGVDLGSGKIGRILWESVESVFWNEGGWVVGLNTHNQPEPVNIDLEFYNIDLKHFVDLVQEHLSRTAHPVLAQLKSPS